MKKINKFHLVAQRQQGLNIKLEWSKIPGIGENIEESSLQLIDHFTTQFANEKDLKNYIKQYALELGLSIKQRKYSENDLAKALEDFLLSKFNDQVHSYELKRTLYAFCSSIGSDLFVLRKLQDAKKTNVQQDNKQQIYQAIIIKAIFEYIKNGPFLPEFKQELFDYIKGLMVENQLVKQLNEEVEKMEINFIFETHPLKIIFYIGSSQRVLYDGVAYKNDAPFIDQEFIMQYLTARTIENDFDLLNRIIRLYNKNSDYAEYIEAIRKYIQLQKEKADQSFALPTEAIKKMVERDTEEVGELAFQTKKNRDGSPIINYYNLRKLGMFLSRYEKEKQHQYASSREANHQNVRLLMDERLYPKKPDKPFQLSMFDSTNKN